MTTASGPIIVTAGAGGWKGFHFGCGGIELPVASVGDVWLIWTSAGDVSLWPPDCCTIEVLGSGYESEDDDGATSRMGYLPGGGWGRFTIPGVRLRVTITAVPPVDYSDAPWLYIADSWHYAGSFWAIKVVNGDGS